MVPVNENKIEKGTVPDQDPISRAEGILLDMWLDEFEGNAVFPTVNQRQWRKILHSARSTRKEIPLIGVGCPAWGEIPGATGFESEFLRDLPMGGRPLRFAKGLVSLQKALASFGVNVLPCLTLSSVEALMWSKLKSVRVMDDRDEVIEMVDSSQMKMAEMISRLGGRAVFFDHMDFVTESWKCDADGVFEEVNSEEDIGSFVRRLVRRDVTELPNQLSDLLRNKGRVTTDPVWLDMMAPSLEEDRELVAASVSELNPDLPMVGPFRNVSRWAAREVAQESFITKQDLASRWLGVEDPANITRETWLRQVLAMSDTDLEKKLDELGICVKINSMREKNGAVELVERIVFGESSFVDGRLVQNVSIGNGSTVLAILTTATNQAGNHIRGLLSEGRVRLNGKIVEDPTILVKKDDILQVGKKINLRITSDV